MPLEEGVIIGVEPGQIDRRGGSLSARFVRKFGLANRKPALILIPPDKAELHGKDPHGLECIGKILVSIQSIPGFSDRQASETTVKRAPGNRLPGIMTDMMPGMIMDGHVQVHAAADVDSTAVRDCCGCQVSTSSQRHSPGYPPAWRWFVHVLA